MGSSAHKNKHIVRQLQSIRHYCITVVRFYDITCFNVQHFTAWCGLIRSTTAAVLCLGERRCHLTPHCAIRLFNLSFAFTSIITEFRRDDRPLFYSPDKLVEISVDEVEPTHCCLKSRAAPLTGYNVIPMC